MIEQDILSIFSGTWFLIVAIFFLGASIFVHELDVRRTAQDPKQLYNDRRSVYVFRPESRNVSVNIIERKEIVGQLRDTDGLAAALQLFRRRTPFTDVEYV